MRISPFIQLVRPEQWIKNGFIFFPLFFHGRLFDTGLLLQCVVAFFAFLFAAGSIYCFNDIYDVETDRLHPVKNKRPVAAGKISIKKAYTAMAVCFVLSPVIAMSFGGETKISLMALIAVYYVMNMAYCMILKHFIIVDVIVIAVGFVLRILAGGAATGILLSEWMIIITFLLALFLAFAKRRDDVVLYQHTGILLRKNINRYNPDFMNQVMTIVSSVTIIAYIMYTLSPEVIERFHCRYIYVTAIFVLAGFIRYLQVTIVDLKSGNPATVFLKDRFLLLCIAGWMISFLIIIYL